MLDAQESTGRFSPSRARAYQPRSGSQKRSLNAALSAAARSSAARARASSPTSRASSARARWAA